MVLCIVAAIVLGIVSIFSASYRPLANEAFNCVFKTITLKPCDTGFDTRLKAGIVSKTLEFSPAAAKVVNKHFTVLSWIFVLITVASIAYSAYGVYNYYYYGNCDGPGATQACAFNYLTGDFGRFKQAGDLIAPTALDGMTAGNPASNVTVVEFGCFTCPYTKKNEEAIQELLKTEDFYYVFKPFPIPTHANSREAAAAVLCAYEQGNHWKLRELVFKQQDICTREGELHIRKLANESGLDMKKFDECFESQATNASVEKYFQQGTAAGLYATPTFFVNGKALVGVKTVDELRTAIREARRG